MGLLAYYTHSQADGTETHIALSHLLSPINAASSPPAKAEFTMRDVTKDEVEADCAAEAVLLVSRLLLGHLRTIDVIHDSVGLTTLLPTFHKLSWRFLEMAE